MKTALITGGNSGIGRACAITFATNNYKVYILGRNKLKLETVKKLNSNIDYIECDIQNKLKLQEVINKIENIDVLINCAGIINSSEEEKFLDLETLDYVLDINLKGTITTSLLTIEKMINNNVKGTIINISSIAAHNGSKYFPIYSASKGGIISFTKSIASRYGEKGIRCNVISPGVIKTPMSYIETPNFDDYIEEISTNTPLGRLGEPSDIANVALFLSSNQSNFITGQEIIVDGGYTLSQE